MKFTITGLATFTFVLGVFLPAISTAEEFSYRVECRKTSDRGCTADNTSCKTAPSGQLFINVKMAGGQGWLPEKVRCSKSEGDQRSVLATVNLPDGTMTTVDVTGYTQICVNAHAESGSGGANLNKVAWANCTVT